MSDDVATVKAICGCFAQGDIAGILSRLHPDIEWEHDWGTPPLGWYRPRRGRNQVSGFFDTLGAFEFVEFTPLAFLTGDDLMAVPIRMELVVRANGNRIRDLEAHLWTFGADRLATRFRHLVDTHQFAVAAGRTAAALT